MTNAPDSLSAIGQTTRNFEPDDYSQRRRKMQRVLARLLSVFGKERSAAAYSWTRKWFRFAERATLTTYGFAYDWWRYLRYSFTLVDPSSKAHLAYFIRMRYHTIEKGLALKEPRPGFGAAPLSALSRAVETYVDRYGPDYLSETVGNVLREYQELNRRNGVNDPIRLDGLTAASPRWVDCGVGGTLPVSQDDLEYAEAIDFWRFATSRHSVRQYEPVDVDPKKVERAISCGQRAPSVCNRQAVKTHVFLGSEQTQALLQFQNGHRGFGQDLRCAIVITADLGSYYKPGERFEPWVDGGLFCMSLIYGLHAEGLASCCLNWNVNPAQDRRMRVWAGIPDNEVVITMLAVGVPAQNLIVAQSPRRPLSEVAKWIGRSD